MFNGTNNGAIFLSVRDATARLGLADFKAAQAAFAELQQLGWITETVSGCFAVKAGELSRARAWQLNWIGRDGRCVNPAALPPLDYGQLTKTQRRRVDRRQTVLSEYLKDYQRGRFERQNGRRCGWERGGIHNAKQSERPKTANSLCWGIHHTHKVPFPYLSRTMGGETGTASNGRDRRLR